MARTTDIAGGLIRPAPVAPDSPTAPRPLVGTALCVVIGVLAIAPAAAALASAVDDGNATAGDSVTLFLACAFMLAGLLLVRRRDTTRLGLLVLLAVVVGGSAALAGVIGRGAADGLEALGVALTFAVALHILVGLPDGRLRSRFEQSVVVGGYVGFGAAGLIGWIAGPDPPAWPFVLVVLVAAPAGSASANRRYAEARGLDRQRMQWVGLAGALWIEVVIVVGGLHVLIDWPAHAVEAVAAALVLVAVALGAAATPTVVGQIDRFLAHAVSAAGLTAVVTVIYVVLVIGLGRVPTEDEKSILVLSMVAAAVSALLYPTANARLRRLAGRLVYGRSESPIDALAGFGDRLTRSVSMNELLLQLTEQCVSSLDLRSAEVWTGADGRFTRSASTPERPPAHLVIGPKELPVVTRARISGRSWAEVWLPQLLEPLGGGPIRIASLVHTNELFGLLVLERSETEGDFSDQEDQLLADLARQIALALHNSELDSALQATLDEVRQANIELQESRARIVAAADSERRRIERDLHDGAQQHLVALAVKLRLIQQLADADLQQALAMVEEARTDALATVEELRALAHGIFPPLLVDKGLRDALSAAAGRSPVHASVRADGIGRYRQEDEAAVYFCCLEALQNAAKHAGEHATVSVELREADGQLRFAVSDDGPGFDVGTRGSGHGFVNMKDRVGALGGTVDVWSRPGEGTRVSGHIPVRPALSADAAGGGQPNPAK